MKVKKAIALLCATTMVMSMAACGSKSDSGKSDNKAATTTSKTDGDALVVKYSVVFLQQVHRQTERMHWLILLKKSLTAV